MVTTSLLVSRSSHLKFENTNLEWNRLPGIHSTAREDEQEAAQAQVALPLL